jgi:Transposase DNA-binding
MLTDLSLHEGDPELWARTHFAQADLGHFSRICRVETIAAALATSPGRPIPQLFSRTYDVKAAYTLFDHPTATPDHLQQGHRAWVKDQLAQPGTVLLLEDTTTVSFSHRCQPIPGLGAVGDGSDGLQGFFLHSVLAVRIPDEAALATDPTREHTGGVVVVGLADQQYYIRTPRPGHERRGCGVNSRRDRPRESQRWIRSTTRLGPAPDDPRMRRIRVADAEADIHDYLKTCINNGYQFVVRMCQDRIILDQESRDRLGTLWEVARAAPAVTSYALELRARPGQAKRTAMLSVSFGALCVRPPAHQGRAAEPISCWFVRAWEECPPAGVEPLEWVLACGFPVATAADAMSAVGIYAQRSLIEEFHKGLKTGMGAERLQLETGHRLYAAIALMSVVTLRLLDLRERAWVNPEAPAEQSGLDALERQLLSRRLGRVLKTVRDVILAIGRLGGHLNRKADGLPGWLTLHRGMKVLRNMVEGVRLVLPVEGAPLVLLPPVRPGTDGCG